MTFLAPVSLLFLAPWFVVAGLLLRGRGQRRDVPFLDLWQGPVETPPAKRAVRPPPTFVIAMLLATLAAIVAAARPATIYSNGGHATIIVDRGITMSAGNRFRELAKSLDSTASSIDLIAVPGEVVQTDDAHWRKLVEDMPATAARTREALERVVRERLSRDDGAIVVLSDQTISIDDPRVVRVAPKSVPRNVSMVGISIREFPVPQLMLRLRNQTELTAAKVVITSGSKRIERRVELPARDGEKAYFIDLAGAGDLISAEIDVADDLSADNRAWLVRQRSWPRIDVTSPLSQALQRMIDVYGKNRPAGEMSRNVRVGSTEDSNVVITSATEHPADGALRVVQHPLTRDLEWAKIIGDATVGTMPAGWTPVVSIGDRPIVVVRESSRRQVWIGFDSPTFATRAEFVIFWTNVFDWVGEGGSEFVSEPVQQIGAEWSALTPTTQPAPPSGLWPGVFKRSDGAVRAINALDVRFDAPTPSPANAASIQSVGSRAVDRSAWLIIVAIALSLLAATAWPRRETVAA